MGNRSPGKIRKKGYEAYGDGLNPYDESPYQTPFARSMYLPIWLAGWHDAENDEVKAAKDSTYNVYDASDDEEGCEQCEFIGSVVLYGVTAEEMPDKLEINGYYYIREGV